MPEGAEDLSMSGMEVGAASETAAKSTYEAARTNLTSLVREEIKTMLTGRKERLEA